MFDRLGECQKQPSNPLVRKKVCPDIRVKGLEQTTEYQSPAE